MGELLINDPNELCGDFGLDKTSNGFWRTSCSCGESVIKQPDMNDEEWNKIREIFVFTHCGEEPT